MSTTGSDRQSDSALLESTFLTTEYERIWEALWKNEEAGDRRVNYFITITSALIAGIVALFHKDVELKGNERLLAIAGAIVFDLAIGVTTFFRMVHRNAVTDSYKLNLDLLREQFKMRVPSLGSYQPQFGEKRPVRFRFGLAQTVAAINSILLCPLLAILAYLGAQVSTLSLLGSSIVHTAAVALAILFFVVQYQYAKRG